MLAVFTSDGNARPSMAQRYSQRSAVNDGKEGLRPFFSSFFKSLTTFTISLPIYLKVSCSICLVADCSPAILFRRTSISTIATVIWLLPSMPGYHEKEPSAFCNFWSFPTAISKRLLMPFSSKKSAKRCFCSLSRSAAFTHGVSFSTRSFNS